MYDFSELDDLKAKLISKNRESCPKEGIKYVGEQLSVQEMHDEFVTLTIDIFNMHSYDPYLRQLTMLLIARYYSERSEFVRNLHRSILLFDRQDWLFYLWIQQQLDKLVFNSEKSNIWLLKIKKIITNFDQELIEEIETTDELKNLKEILVQFHCAVTYDCQIYSEKEGDEVEYSIKFVKGERKTRFFSQELYRNMKVYDYLINFLFQNKELFLKVRRLDRDILDESQKEIVKIVREIFRSIFDILKAMTKDNTKTQELMWKYKEEFIFDNLGDAKQEGELELVLAIIDDSQEAIKYQQNKWTLSKTRQFVNSLNKRIKNNDNFVLILEIYNKLIKFEVISFLKPSLVKLIMKDPGAVHSLEKSSKKEFEKSQNLQEILYSIIQNQEMIFTRDFMIEQFPLEDMFEEIEQSIQRLNEIEKEDISSDAQDYEELRHFQYISLVKIYIQLYFHPQFSNLVKEELEESFLKLVTIYIKKLNDLISQTTFDNTKKSYIRFLLVYGYDFFHKMEIFYKKAAEAEIPRRTESHFREFSHLERRDTISSYPIIKAKKDQFEDLREQAFKILEDSGEEFEEIIDEIHNLN